MAENFGQKSTKLSEKTKLSNAVGHSVGESMRVGETDKIINHPTSLSSTPIQRKKTPAFQITSVTVGARTSNEVADDSADDLDESHTEDISDVIDTSRITDIENETPSFSEDTFSKDDVFFNATATALGTAPVIPTSSQYGLAIVPPETNELGIHNSVGSGNNVNSDVHTNVSEAGSVINIVGAVKQSETEMRDVHSHAGRNDRFKVVKIESTEPFKRGRWTCMDYLDHSMIQQQQSQQAIINVKQNESDSAVTSINYAGADSGVVLTDSLSNQHLDEMSSEDNLGATASVSEHNLTGATHMSMLNPNAGQAMPSNMPSSPGQSLLNINQHIPMQQQNGLSHQGMINQQILQQGMQANYLGQSVNVLNQVNHMQQAQLSHDMQQNLVPPQIVQHAQSMTQVPIQQQGIGTQPMAQSMPQQQIQQLVSSVNLQQNITHQDQGYMSQINSQGMSLPQPISQQSAFYQPGPNASMSNIPVTLVQQPIVSNLIPGQSNILSASASSSDHVSVVNQQIPVVPQQSIPVQISGHHIQSGVNVSNTGIAQSMAQVQPQHAISHQQIHSQIPTQQLQHISGQPIQNIAPQVQQITSQVPQIQNQQVQQMQQMSTKQVQQIPAQQMQQLPSQHMQQMSNQPPPQISVQLTQLPNQQMPSQQVSQQVTQITPQQVSQMTAQQVSQLPLQQVQQIPVQQMAQIPAQKISQVPSQIQQIPSQVQKQQNIPQQVVAHGQTGMPMQAQQMPPQASSHSHINVQQLQQQGVMSGVQSSSPQIIQHASTLSAAGTANQNVMNTQIQGTVSQHTAQSLPSALPPNISGTVSQQFPQPVLNVTSQPGASVLASGSATVVAATRTPAVTPQVIPGVNISMSSVVDPVTGIVVGTVNNPVDATQSVHSAILADGSPVIADGLAESSSTEEVKSAQSTTGEDAESISVLERALSGHTCRPREPQPPAPPCDAHSASGTSAVAIDNKIEQAMDLVKSHLMFAVREEVEVLKEKIAELMDRISQLELENTFLKAHATPETLSQLGGGAQPQPPPQQQSSAPPPAQQQQPPPANGSVS